MLLRSVLEGVKQLQAEQEGGSGEQKHNHLEVADCQFDLANCMMTQCKEAEAEILLR